MPVVERERVRQEVKRSLDRSRGSNAWLPMEHKWGGNNTITYEEWEEWWERHKRQACDEPNHDDAFGRPSYTSVKRILRHLKKWIGDLTPIYLTTRLKLDKDEQEVRKEAAKIGLIVGLVAFAHRGTGTHRITYTMLVDALARKFSDHYLRASQVAPSITYMRKDTVQAIGRDLLLSGVSGGGIWKTLIGYGKNPRFPLYRVSEQKTGDELAYFVTPRATSRPYKSVTRTLSEDRKFSQLEPRRQLLRIVSRVPSHGSYAGTVRKHDVDYDVCAEWKYNIVALTDQSEELLRIQEDVCLLFNVGLFKRDYLDRKEETKKVRRSIRQKYHIDPTKLSTSRRAHSSRSRRPQGKGKRTIRRRPSQRENEVYYRSIEMALTKDAPAADDPGGRPSNLRVTRRISFRKKTISTFLEWVKKKGRRINPASMITSKPAIDDHPKTGQRRASETELF